MPIPTTRQSQMDVHMGKSPAVNDSHIIDDISFRMNVVTKAAAYTVLPSQSGTLFTTSGATGGVTFTLPAAEDGLIYWFVNAVDGDMKVSAPSAIMVCYNNAAATTVSFETASEQIGSGFEIFSDGTNWYAGPFNGLATATMTVA